MHIAQIVPRGEQPSSGILTVIVHLAAALRRRGHRVDVIQLHRWDPVRYEGPLRVLREAGVEEVQVAGTWTVGRETASIVESRGVEVAHLHGAFNPWNTRVSRALRRPYVFSPHSGYNAVSLRRSATRKTVYRVLFERRLLENACFVAALTDAELAEVRAFGARGPCEVIPNGVAPAPDGLDRLTFRQELGVGPGRLAVFVGRLDVDRKGLDVLVRGVAAAPAWHLALVGPRFRDVDRLMRLVSALGAGDRIHVVGERHGRALLESVAAADVFTLLSRWEGLPMALLEALSLGIPAAVSPAVERVIGVETSGAGWVTPGEADLGRLLAQLDAAEIERRSHAALELARRYDWDVIAIRYETAYGRALESE